MPATGPAFSLLEQIDTPPDLRSLPEARLPALAGELREFLIQTVARTGGHFSANLGTVELTIALHYVFNTPEDRLVWDVGHQTYPHKILTGRRQRMPTLRRKDGIAGFPKRGESPYDTFGVGHSSTSLSAALGMAIAAERAGSDRKIVAIIGDGAMTAGMAFEALNHAGHLKSDLLVVLNDNEMSISPNVGALSKYLDKVRTDRTYNKAKDELAAMTARLPQGELLVELGKRMKDSLKEFVYHAMIWEELGFTYIGPIDGHDIRDMVDAFKQASQVEGPVFVHVITQKGKGYA
ncbi:MAG: 1-deoxy-D-xylulose-5-phosphate synthase, partial [Candidatus Competibacteraceae bacterium]|nr:1-deoxy-D-xylulose-5-phosphate synthase [Candidatus Competibacteraceae bacterium]